MHLCTECPATAHRCALAFGGGLWTTVVLRIADALYAAHKRGPPPAVLRNAISTIVMPSPEWAFITARIITSSPWPKSSAHPAWETTARLGHMFDKDMTDHGAAHLADAWATEAHAFLASTAIEWWRLQLALSWKLPPSPSQCETPVGNVVTPTRGHTWRRSQTPDPRQ